jgi:hypothetical protein
MYVMFYSLHGKTLAILPPFCYCIRPPCIPIRLQGSSFRSLCQNHSPQSEVTEESLWVAVYELSDHDEADHEEVDQPISGTRLAPLIVRYYLIPYI